MSTLTCEIKGMALKATFKVGQASAGEDGGFGRSWRQVGNCRRRTAMVAHGEGRRRRKLKKRQVELNKPERKLCAAKSRENGTKRSSVGLESSSSAASLAPLETSRLTQAQVVPYIHDHFAFITIQSLFVLRGKCGAFKICFMFFFFIPIYFPRRVLK